MDEFWGGLAGVIFVIAVVVTIVRLIIMGFGLLFLWFNSLLGHPVLVVTLLGVIGAGLGIVRLRRRHGALTSNGANDYATIGSIRLTPEGWAVMVLCLLAVTLFLYGAVFVAGR